MFVPPRRASTTFSLCIVLLPVPPAHASPSRHDRREIRLHRQSYIHPVFQGIRARSLFPCLCCAGRGIRSSLMTWVESGYVLNQIAHILYISFFFLKEQGSFFSCSFFLFLSFFCGELADYIENPTAGYVYPSFLSFSSAGSH